MELLLGGAPQRGAKLESISLPSTTAQTAGLVSSLTSERATAAVLNGYPSDATASMNAAAELAARFGATGEPDSLGFLYGPDRAAIDRMWLALEADEPDQAESVVQDVDPRPHPFSVNRSLLLDPPRSGAAHRRARLPYRSAAPSGGPGGTRRVADPRVGTRDERRVAVDGLPRRSADRAELEPDQWTPCVSGFQFLALLPWMWMGGVWYGRVPAGVGRTGVI
jgi:hypothetical protein